MQTNVIKQNNFHVEEDFYEEIINGLQSAREREQMRDTKQPLVVLPRQGRFITYVTTPVIMGQLKPLVENVTRYYYQIEKWKKTNNLYTRFAEGLAKFATLDSVVNDEIEELEERSFNAFKILKVIKILKRMSRFYSAIKMYKKPQNSPKFEVDIQQLTNPSYFSQFDSKFTQLVMAQEKVLVPVFVGFTYPTAKRLFAMYDQKLEELYVGFWKWCFKNFIFDPESALDWTILAISFVAAFGGAVVGSVAGPVGSVAGAVVAAGAVASVAKSAKIAASIIKVGNALRKIKRAVSFVKKVPGIVKASKIATRAVKGGATKVKNFLVPTSTTLWGRAKHAYKVYGTIRRYTKRSINYPYMIYSGIDFLDVTPQDVEDYRRYITRRTSIWGRKFEANYSDDLSRMLNMGTDVFDFADVKTKSLIEGIMSSRENGDGDSKLSQLLSEKFGSIIQLQGFSDLKISKILDEITMKISLLWSQALKGCPDLFVFDKTNNLKEMGNKITFNDDGVVDVIFTNGTEKWNRMEIITKNDASGHKYIKFGKDGHVVSYAELKDYSKNKDYSSFKPDIKTYKRIYQEGFAVGFKIKIVQRDVYGKATDVNLEKYKIWSIPNESKNNVVLHSDGYITFSDFRYSNSSSELNTIISVQEKIIDQEKSAQQNVKKINESMMLSYGENKK